MNGTSTFILAKILRTRMATDSERLHDDDWRLVKGSDAFFEGAARYRDLLEIIGRLQPKKVLDLGCGSGYVGQQLKTRIEGVVVEGVDISSVALERAKAHLDRCWKVNIDQTDLPMASAQYDVAVCVETLEHLYDPDHALQELCRVLTPGGRALVTVPNLAFWRYRLALLAGRVPLCARDRRHLHQFNLPLIEDLLTRAGLHVVAVTGHAVRVPWLARARPSLFSDLLIITVEKR